MPPLPVPREETFARALSIGVSWNAASTEAGYGRHWERGRERAARPEIVARASEVGEALTWGEACEVSEMIRALMRLAGKAGQMQTAAAMVAARGLVAEAAKLNQRTLERRETPEIVAHDIARYMPLSDEDWAAKYGHRA